MLVSGNPGCITDANPTMQLGMFKEARADCEAALELCYTCKTLLRRGTAYVGLGDLHKALLDFRQALYHEPGNRYVLILVPL